MTIKRLGLFIALIALAAGLLISLSAQPTLLNNVRWGPAIILTLIVSPVILICNALEFYFVARLLGRQFGIAECFQVTVIGSAANLLPLPGSAAVRVAALKRVGIDINKSLFFSLVTAAISVGVALLYCGLWAILFGEIAIIFAIIGAIILLGCHHISRRYFGTDGFAALCLVRLATVIADGFRFLTAFGALGIGVELGQASVLAISTNLASLVAIVPGGLGIREWLAALAAPLIGLRTVETFVAAALSQIAGLLIVFATAGLLIWRGRSWGELR